MSRNLNMIYHRTLLLIVLSAPLGNYAMEEALIDIPEEVPPLVELAIKAWLKLEKPIPSNIPAELKRKILETYDPPLTHKTIWLAYKKAVDKDDQKKIKDCQNYLSHPRWLTIISWLPGSCCLINPLLKQYDNKHLQALPSSVEDRSFFSDFLQHNRGPYLLKRLRVNGAISSIFFAVAMICVMFVANAHTQATT